MPIYFRPASLTLLGLLLVAGSARAQTESCTVILASGSATTSQVESAINGAAPGDVICLARGSTWAGSLRITNTSGTPANRIVVCSSSASACSPGGGADARFDIGGGEDEVGLAFDAGVKGFILRNLDFVGSSEGTGFAMASNVSDIRFDGGRFTKFESNLCNPWPNTTPCRNIELGVPGNLLEISNNTVLGFYGWLEDSFVRARMIDNGTDPVYDHSFYHSAGLRTDEVKNLVFEYGYYSGSSGSQLKISGRLDGVIIRHNKFVDKACSENWFVDVGGGGDLPSEYVKNLEIYGNLFKGNCRTDIGLEFAEGARIYNNVFHRTGISSNDGVAMKAFGTSSDVWFYNNTVFCEPGRCDATSLFGYNLMTDYRFFNNLLHIAGPNVYIFEATCDRFGGPGGPDFHHNFVYAPNTSDPGVPQCAAGSNSTSYSTPSGLIDPVKGNYSLAPDSPALGAGAAADAPADDYAGNARANPPSIGALDAASVGSADAMPPDPPVVVDWEP